MARFRKGKKAFKKFDGFEWKASATPKDKKLYWRYQRFLFDKQCDDVDNHWMCGCGHYEESGWHCSVCGAEPPWGCDCSFCNDERLDYEEDDVIYFEGDFYGMADGL